MPSDAQQLELLSGLQNGDPDAWGALFRQFAPQVWQFVAKRMLGAASNAVEDVVQETMMAAAHSAGNFDLERNPSILAWLNGIARNQIAMHYRREQRQNIPVAAANELLASSGKLRHWIADVSGDSVGTPTKSEVLENVRRTLERLPAKTQKLLIGKYFERLTIEQLAVRGETSAAAINSQLARARCAFRKKFVGGESS